MCAFNGSGTFSRTNGTFSGSSVWTQDKNAPVNILSGRHDTHDQDLADGLTNCITKDGQTTVTANLPMATFRHTNVGAASARTDYARTDQVQDSAFTWAGDSGGSSNAYTATLTPAITSYVNGRIIAFRANHTNTGASTLNINSVGTKNLKDLTGAALAAGAINTTNAYLVIYLSVADEFRLLSMQIPVLVAMGGTGATTAAGARSNLGAAASGANADITSITTIQTLSRSSGDITVSAASGDLVLATDGTSRVKLDAADLRPNVAGATNLGTDSFHWAQVVTETVRGQASADLDLETQGATNKIVGKVNGVSLLVLDPADNSVRPAGGVSGTLGNSTNPWFGAAITNLNFRNSTLAGSAGASVGYITIQVDGVSRKIQYFAV